MNSDTLNIIIDALVDYGFSELDAIYLVGRLLDEEAPHLLEHRSVHERMPWL